MDDDRQQDDRHVGDDRPVRPAHLRPVPDVGSPAAPADVDAEAQDVPEAVEGPGDEGMDPLLEQVRRIEDLPVGERAQAFETLNRQLVSALNQLEQL